MHSNARSSPLGMVLLVIGGESVARVARGMGMSRQCVSKWVRRYREEGRAGLEDRSSRPRCSPMRTSREVEEQVLRSVASVGMRLTGEPLKTLPAPHYSLGGKPPTPRM